MSRHLRISSELQPQHRAIVDFYPSEGERALHIDGAVELRDKVDRLRAAQDLLKDKNAAHKRDIEGLSAEIAELSAELREYARENNKTRLSGVESVLEFTPGVSRRIAPAGFLSFLKDMGKTQEFWDYVTVPIGQVEKHFGEAVLETSGVLLIEKEEFKNMKFTRQRG